MPDISITKSHHLSHEDAKAAARKIADKLAEKFSMAIAWDEDVLSFERPGVSGTLTVYASEARIDVVLGDFFKFFKAKLEEQITENMHMAFADKL